MREGDKANIQIVYSIRLPRQPGETECGHCGQRFRAAGPTGYAGDAPICDACLLENDKELGMVLALVAVNRAYVTAKYASPEEHWEGLTEIGAFARIYERVARRSGPPRFFQKPAKSG